MVNVPKKALLRKAVEKKNKFDMSSQVVTTNNFGVVKPIYLRYCVPGDNIVHCSVNEFQRLMPMPSPTFGRLESITRAFFVPMRSIFHAWNEYISQNFVPYSATGSGVSLSPKIPCTTVANLNSLFRVSESGLTSSGTSSTYDFYRRTNDGNVTYYRFTVKGKRVFDLFNSIGLQFPWLHQSQESTLGTAKVSLLPLLAVLKLYYDWFVPSRYVLSYQNIQSFINTTYSAFPDVVPYSTLNKLLFELRSWLEDDFFTSAFESASGQTNQQNLAFNYSSPVQSTDGSSSVSLESDSSSVSNNPNLSARLNPDTNGSFDWFTLKTLGALQSMLTRGMLAGTKIQDWLESEFGMKPSNDALGLSYYFGKQVSQISIGDVTSFADTSSSDGAYLGQYAGKGVGSGKSNWKYKCKEHGFYIITNEILPRTTYYQGLAPEFQMTDVYDFYQPEFDNIGVEAIPLKTLCNVSDQHAYPGAATEISNPNDVFGFAPRYASLKTSFDRISGDFRVPTLNTGLNSWYLSRDMRLETGFDEQYKHISAAFCDASTGTSTNNYDRIFQSTSNNADHFYQIFYIDCQMVRPMKSVSQYALENEDEHGDVIAVKQGSGIDV